MRRQTEGIVRSRICLFSVMVRRILALGLPDSVLTTVNLYPENVIISPLHGISPAWAQRYPPIVEWA